MTIHFPDLSHFEAGVSLAGVPALLTKATQGTGYTDPTYAPYRGAARLRGIPFGGYHYVTLDDPQAQARHAYSVLGTTPAMWDIEKGSGTLAHLLATHDAFADLGGRAVFAYVPRWYWQQIGSPDLRPLTARGLALISSQYTTYSDTGPGWKPYGGVTPTIWQYTDAGLCNGRHVDMNAFRGTATELARLFNPPANPDQGVDVTTLDSGDIALLKTQLTPALVEAILSAPIFVRPAGEQSDTGLSLAWAARGGYFRAGSAANTQLPALAVAVAAQTAQITGLVAAVHALGSGGTNVDTAAVINAVNAAATAESAAVTALHDQIADLERRLAAAETAAAQASAAVLAPPAGS